GVGVPTTDTSGAALPGITPAVRATAATAGVAGAPDTSAPIPQVTVQVAPRASAAPSRAATPSPSPSPSPTAPAGGGTGQGGPTPPTRGAAGVQAGALANGEPHCVPGAFTPTASSC